MSFRLAANIAVAALLCSCGAPKAGSTASGPATSPAAGAAAVRPLPPAGPMNAPVSAAGQPGSIPLDAAQQRELAATVAKVPAVQRVRLRYALALADDGKRHLVVYDGQGLAANGKHPGKRFEYVVFSVLNAHDGEHYDPQQNSIVPKIPPPVQRDNSI